MYIKQSILQNGFDETETVCSFWKDERTESAVCETERLGKYILYCKI